MKSHAAPTNEFFDLMADLAEDRLSPEQAARLEELLWADEANRQHYIDFMLMVTGLYRTRSEGSNNERGTMTEPRGLGISVPSGMGGVLPIPDLTVPHSSFLTLPSSFVGGVFFSYVIAVLVVGVGLTIAGAWKLPDHAEIARQSVPLHSPLSTLPSAVGRITGMIDCQWEKKGFGIRDWGLEEDSRSKTQGSDNHKSKIQNPKSLVVLGDRFALASGLMEITYDTGAIVILQGPCTYEVESKAGGYLSIGKLTARVEKKAESGGRRAENAEVLPSPLRLPPSALFAVRTPTATVTDLGTEFGVEVAKSGDTVSHVFQGSVELQVVSTNTATQPFACVLRENQSARVERSENPDDGGNRVTVSDPSAKPADFVRKMVKPLVRTLDLVDVVAGGDGFSGRRNRGIDPTTGRPCDLPPQEFNIDGDGAYHRVEGLPLVDGVFIPDDRAGPVQVDSAGHTFGGFATSHNMTYGYVWAGGVVPTGIPPTVRTELNGVDYAASGHGLIFLHANKGITFDLEAMRRANPNWKLRRFLAVAGNSEVISQGILGPIDEQTAGMVCADIRVLVDGELRWYRHGINGTTGGFPIAVSIGEEDRFLTLVGTDGGNDIHADWIMFGDPRVELVPNKQTP